MGESLASAGRALCRLHRTPLRGQQRAGRFETGREGRFRDRELSTSLEAETDFGFGDLFVQPVWLGWSGKHYDIAAGYGFYAPTGEDGLSLEFWEHQLQVAGTWYPFEQHGTAVMLAGTFEINHEREDKDITPGERFTLNWGISQYLPLNKEQTWLAEIGTSGYSQWQVEEDSGSDVPQIRRLNVQLDAKDEVHAAGIQAGVAFVPWKAALTFRYQWEFDAEARFEGENLVVTPREGILILVLTRRRALGRWISRRVSGRVVARGCVPKTASIAFSTDGIGKRIDGMRERHVPE